MKGPSFRRRLLDSTRGQVLLLLRTKPRTVNDLAASLNLTGNAVRAHLTSLERDRLVQRRGTEPGFRKPHVTYGLTADAELVFPKAYGPILNQVVSVLEERIGPAETETVLREVGRRIVPPQTADKETAFEERLNQAMKSLENLGGHASLSREDGKVVIHGAGCPLSAATTDHGVICKMVETFLSEIIGAPVHQTCQRESSPQCCFEVGVLSPPEP